MENGNVILGSDTPDSQWTIYVNPSATVNMSYIVVRDSACGDGTKSFGPSETINNGGNNGNCWEFIGRGIIPPGLENASGGGALCGGGACSSNRGHGGRGGGGGGDCSPATGTATLSGDGVAGVSIVSAGLCYASTPTIFFCEGGGNGAAGTATISDGAVTEITVTNAGSSYTSAPTIVISQPDGSGGGCPTSGGGQGGSGGGGGASVFDAFDGLPENTNWLFQFWNWLVN